MADHDDRAAGRPGLDRLPEPAGAGRVQVSGGLVEQQLGVPEERAGQRDLLPLARRKPLRPFAKLLVVAAGQRLDELGGAGQPGRPPDRVQAGPGTPERDVVGGGAGQVKKNKKPGLVSRMIASPSPLSAFGVGVLLFAPGVTFLAALQVIATAQADIELTTLAVAISVLIDVALVWLPLVLFLLAPALTEHRLKAFNGWLRAHGSTLLVGAIVVAGALMVFDGSYGLITGK